MKRLNLYFIIIAALNLIGTVANAGDGTAANPFTVCKGSQFKLTSNVYANPTTFTWTRIAGSATGTEGTLISGSDIQGTYLVPATTGDAAGDILRYTLQVQSGDGCISALQTFYVRVVDPAVILTLGTGTEEAYCQELITESGQVIHLVASSPNAGYTIPNNTFSWSAVAAPATVTNADAATTSGTVPNVPGTYTFTVNTSATVDIAPVGGCMASASVAVEVSPTPAAPVVTISAE